LIAAGEAFHSEMPLAAAQDAAGLLVTPACLACLRACGSRRAALRKAFELVGEDDASCKAEEATPRGCSTGGGCFGSRACADAATAAAHRRLCQHAAAPALRALAATAGPANAVWLAALLLARGAIAMERGDACDAVQVHGGAHRSASRAMHTRVSPSTCQALDRLRSHPWTDIPAWSGAPPATTAARGGARRAVVRSRSSRLRQIFGEARCAALTDEASVSNRLGLLDTCALDAWVRSGLNGGWEDWDEGAGQWAHELLPCIREAILCELEATRLPTAAGLAQDSCERQAEPLFRGFPPSEALALYASVALLNHACDGHVAYRRADRLESTLTAERDIRPGAELTT